MNKNEFCIFLDAGHGGINPKVKLPNGYTTYPAKCSQHNNGIFHSYGWFFEGVFNRAVVQYIEQYLNDWGFVTMKVYDEVLDTSLTKRVNKANFAAKNYKASLYLSIHGNAAENKNARGWEVFTSPGQTKSDIYAEILFKEVKQKFPNWIYRADLTDGDHDKEARFHVLTQTDMPSVLSENGFFTNYHDAKLMFDTDFQKNIGLCHARAVGDYIEKIGLLNA
jgi:N-acetylmuramoyl-L-alanine amidase